jgi:hypothetical protein
VMQVVLLPCIVSCGGFKLGSRGFLVRSSALLDLARSNRFIKLPCVALSFYFMFKFM